MGCLLILLAIPLPWVSLLIVGKTKHAIAALCLQFLGIIMLFAAIIPLLGWLIAFLGAMLLFGNMIWAVVDVAQSQSKNQVVVSSTGQIETSSAKMITPEAKASQQEAGSFEEL